MKAAINELMNSTINGALVSMIIFFSPICVGSTRFLLELFSLGMFFPFFHH